MVTRDGTPVPCNVTLLMMVAVVGLLIAPAAHHRVADDGDATRRVMRIITLAMSGALLLFALALGINIYIGIERIAGSAAAAGAGVAGAPIALVCWFGIEWAAVKRKDGKDTTMNDEPIPLAKKIDQMLTEARVILPGAQALLGFQLAVILTEAFEKLPGSSQATHAAALGFVAVCTMLLMTPAAYHRIVYAGEESSDLLKLGGRFVMGATVALALGLAADVYVVIAKISESTGAGAAAALVTLAALVGLWHLSPWYLRVQREGERTARFAGSRR